MARPGGVWRLALGVLAFVLFSSGNVALVGLPFAGLLLAAGPSGVRDWVLVVVALLLGALGILSPTSHGQLDGVVSAYIVLVSVCFVSIALLQPASFLRMGLSATATFTTNHDWVSWAGRVCIVWSPSPHQATGYEVTVSSPSRTPIPRRPRIEAGEDQRNVGLRAGTASRRCPRFPSSGSANGLPAGGPGALRRRACPIARASQ